MPFNYSCIYVHMVVAEHITSSRPQNLEVRFLASVRHWKEEVVKLTLSPSLPRVAGYMLCAYA